MSTRSTMAHGDNFHLYKDLMDEGDAVHLRIDNPCGHSDYICIPPEIWEVIRTVPAVSFDLADKTDAELKAQVTKDVDERLVKYKAAKDKQGRSLVSLFGFGLYGGANEPRAQQIKNGLSHYRKERKALREIRKKMQAYKTGW